MKLYRGEVEDKNGIYWGPITLDFAIRLLHFIRSEFLTMSPPLNYPTISMPLEKDLIRRGQHDLAAMVIKFGGYENIARRLGLAYFDLMYDQMNDVAFRGARYLWKQRNTEDTSTILTKPLKAKLTSGIKRKGVAWTKDVVVSEL